MIILKKKKKKKNRINSSQVLICLIFSLRLEKILEAITTAGEWRSIERFSPIVRGLRDRSVQLQVSMKSVPLCLSLGQIWFVYESN